VKRCIHFPRVLSRRRLRRQGEKVSLLRRDCEAAAANRGGAVQFGESRRVRAFPIGGGAGVLVAASRDSHDQRTAQRASASA
jgi:hypothetical protein